MTILSAPFKSQYGFETEFTLEQGIRKFLETAIYKQENL